MSSSLQISRGLKPLLFSAHVFAVPDTPRLTDSGDVPLLSDAVFNGPLQEALWTFKYLKVERWLCSVPLRSSRRQCL